MTGPPFELFYNKAKIKADEALKAVYAEIFNKDELSQKAVDYFYRNLAKDEKNLFEYIAILDDEKRQFLGTEKQAIRLSRESLTKNIIRHPELTLKEYYLIPEIVDMTELLIYVPENLEGQERILCFGKKDAYYKATIKSNEKKDENYLVSFHSINLKGINRDKKKKSVKIIYDNLAKK